MKTILEWYNDLPEDVRAKAIAAYDPKFNNGIEMANDLAEAIFQGFDWAETEDGVSFWDNLYIKAIKKTNTDSDRLDWLQNIMTPGSNYCEVFFAGLRSGGQDAGSFQIESNPSLFQTLNAPTVREAIDKAMKSTSPPDNK